MSCMTWEERHRLHVPIAVRSSPGLSCIAFDPYEELVWIGDVSGQVTSFLNIGDASPRYTSFPAHHGVPASQLLIHDSGVISLSSKNVRFTSRCGIQRWNKLMSDARCMSFTNTSSQLHVVGSPTTLSVVNMYRGTIVNEISLDEPIVAMKQGKFMAHATESGRVQFLDPRTMEIEHTILAHAGGILSMDIIGNTMATCGYSIRNGALLPDRLIKLYDIRTMRALSPIPFSVGPEHVRFHPKQPSRLLILSKTGAVQICDITSPNYTGVTFIRADMPGMISSMDISSNSDAFAVGDTTNSCAVFSTHETIRYNPYSRQSEYRSMFVDKSTVEIGDDTPLSAVGMPRYTSELLSAWPNSLLINVGRPQPRIPPEVLKNVKMSDFVGYVQDMPLKRNQNLIMSIRASTPTCASPGLSGPKFRSQQQRDRLHRKFKTEGHSAKSSLKSPETNDPSLQESEISEYHWHKIEIKYSKFGVEDFDFEYYNHTVYGGLETHIQNSYCNPLLQILFFNRPLCELVKSHIRTACMKDLCLACELGFLFRMLEDSKGANCQASNFLRAFGATPEACALGLVDAEVSHTDPQSVLTLQYDKLIQTTMRFLLEQLHQELGAKSTKHSQAIDYPPDEYIKTIYGIPLWTLIKCHGNHDHNRESVPFVIDLHYDHKNLPANFLELLHASINKESSTRAWCDKCQKYQNIKQSRKLTKLPNFLNLNANITNDLESELWRRDTQDGSSCFLLKSFVLRRDADGYLIVDQSGVDVDVDLNSSDVAIYDLKTVVSAIQFENEPTHLVACINVSDDYDAPKWYLFNDFLVQEIFNGEECRFEDWKMPAIIQYIRRTHPDKNEFFLSPVEPDFSILIKHQNINKQKDVCFNYELLTELEIPCISEYICAIDAEFVVMTEAEMEIKSDGSKSIIRPAESGLARVSVIRGMEPRMGVPFIDDYIFISQPVVNYLTEFSGIIASDLDVRTSKLPIVSLKIAYKKLRLLVDIGCIFVGHGLKKDCRTINILIPPHQIIDTVDIYYLKQYSRKLSLRFLVWFFFKEDIHSSSHDSVEDARGALRIYQKYLEAKEQARFDTLLEEIYQEGRKFNFRPPNALTGIANTTQYDMHARTQSSDL
ncbi:poly(A)-specific ribonuclease [Batrachochytrium dendrobatidis]|nr:poly(A)-specific ribonuclease [Batrachochytrium dendrobatidis]KAK5666008.1 poly(A)-specific ribonuclease [Batrachochytrium dendrobatidis]